jgi:zinc transport system permease protein
MTALLESLTSFAEFGFLGRALVAGLALGVMGFLFLRWRHLAQWTLDEELAQANGIRVRALRYAMLLLLAATVVFSVKVVGILLVTSLLILPGAIGSLGARTLASVAGLSVASAVFSAGTGMVLSNTVDVPPGPATVLILFALFVAAFVARHHAERRQARDGQDERCVVDPPINLVAASIPEHPNNP